MHKPMKDKEFGTQGILRRFGALMLSVMLWLATFEPSLAQEAIQLREQRVEYLFDSYVRFEAQFESSAPLVDGHVVVQPEGEARIDFFEAEINQAKQMSVDIEIGEAYSPKAFKRIIYWFVVASENGLVFESQAYEFFYEDNRYDWQTLMSESFEVRWHQGDEAFGRAILSAAEKGVARSQAIVPITPSGNFTFQIYGSAEEVQKVAQLAGFDWVAGHTDPQTGLILLSISPGVEQSLEIERQVPHEVAHLMLYRTLGEEAYARVPAWLKEGIASNAELYSDPVQSQLLELAYQSNALIPFALLCVSFPQDSASARLAYAQAASFVRYLSEQYRDVGIGALLDAYVSEGDCVNAPVAVFGQDLEAMSREWQAATFAEPTGLLGKNIEDLPWATIGLSALIAAVLVLIRRRLARTAS